MKKGFKILMVFVMLISYVLPIGNVIALSYGTGDKFITMDIDNKLGFNIGDVTVNGNKWTGSSDEFRTNNNSYHIEINVSGTEATVDKVPRIEYGGDWNDYMTPSSFKEGNNYKFVLDLDNGTTQTFLALSIKEQEQQQNQNQNQNNEGNNNEGDMPAPGENDRFDEKAYVIWSCGTGTCYHYFDEIPNFDDGNSTFYKDTDITADNDKTIHFDVNAEYKAWALPEKFELWVDAYKKQNNLTKIDWTKVDPEDIISYYPPNMLEWENKAIEANRQDKSKGCARPAEDAPGDEREAFEACIDKYYIEAGNLPFIRLQPVGEPEYTNSYVSYGDRNFKVVIYNSNYKGISMGDLDELNYYPASWTNPFIKRDQFDISGSTKEKPTLLDSILLESTVIIRPLNYNGFAISSIEALDVPEDAVEIVKTNKGEFKLIFSSNFYDNVTFKVTDTKGEVSYVLVKRYTIDAWIGFEDNHPTLIADFYFDRENSYEDFDITAKVIYKDGTFRNVKLAAKDGIDDGLGNITPGYEKDEQEKDEFGNGGKGLKKSTFTFTLEDGDDRNVVDVYLNAEFTGSTETNYAGSYVGSGEGVLANIYHGEED